MKTKKPMDVWDKIDALIGEDIKPQQPDEFTLADLKQRIESNGNKISDTGLTRRIKTLISDGVLISRKITIGRSQTNVYRFV